MATTPVLAPPSARQPKGVSPWFAVALVSALAIGLLIFVAAVERRQPPAPPVPALRDARGDEGWFERVTKPTPAAAPTLRGSPGPVTPSQPLAQPQLMPYQQHAAPDTSQEGSERLERYRRALNSDISIKVGNDQVLETPRLIDTGNAPSSVAPIVVSAQPAPPHTISAWTWIYGTLETGIDSDHPGDVLGRVSEDVKDSVTQSETLIPMGSRLHGYQQGRAQVQQNDSSLLVAWDDIEFPNGGHIPLPKMPGTDSEGYPGFQDLVNNHYVRTWTPAVLISGITAGTMLASRPTYGGINGYSPEQQAMGAGAESLGSRAQGQLATDMGFVKPTLTIRPGYEFRVLVTRDLVFSGAYPK
jgi:type IV secretion system protein VirB10